MSRSARRHGEHDIDDGVVPLQGRIVGPDKRQLGRVHLQPRFFDEFPRGALLGRLVHGEISTGHAPTALVRGPPSFDEQCPVPIDDGRDRWKGITVHDLNAPRATRAVRTRWVTGFESGTAMVAVPEFGGDHTTHCRPASKTLTVQPAARGYYDCFTGR